MGRVGIGGAPRGMVTSGIRRFSLPQTVRSTATGKAAPGADATTEARKLRIEDVKHLAFEGGGGKGFACLGALAALENLKILPVRAGTMTSSQVEAVAGASAGAITALLVSLGYTSQDFLKFIRKTDFNSFFDPPSPRFWPTVGGTQKVCDTSLERFARARAWRMDPQWLVQMTPGVLPMLLELVQWLQQELAGPAGTKTGTFENRLKEHWRDYLVSLPRDMGLWHGDAARRVFLKAIKNAYQRLKNQPGPDNPTFKDLYDDLQVDLLVTASNLTLGQTQLFSWRESDTPDFPVADAVRMSMSIPVVFKPYVLDEDTFGGHPPCGTYVDGGLWNNIPFREFDTSTSGLRPSTLALRLEIEKTLPIHNFASFLAQYVGKFGVFGSGETQVLSKFVNQAILLDTKGLALLDFSPSAKDSRPAVRRAFASVYEYFDRQPPDPGAPDFPTQILGRYSLREWREDLESDEKARREKVSRQTACTQPRKTECDAKETG